MKPIATLLAVLVATAAIQAQNTIQKSLVPDKNESEVPTIEGGKKQSTNEQTLLTFTPRAVTLKGFSKKTGDLRESFSVTNNTNYHISRIKIKIQYTDMHGVVLDEKTRLVDVDIKPGATGKAYIPSFDRQKMYYYYLTPQRNTITAIPFKVAWSLLRYDIVIE